MATMGRRALLNALAALESTYQFHAAGIISFLSYGIPYFNRLPGGMAGSLVSSHMPRLTSDNTRFALEEAVPGPTDVTSANPGISKETFNVPETHGFAYSQEINSDSPIFVPSADFFRVMRINQASLDLQNQFGVDPDGNGLEGFTTATRRQNFLIPPRRHRAFPLVEFA
jgi:hypothetical protein